MGSTASQASPKEASSTLDVLPIPAAPGRITCAVGNRHTGGSGTRKGHSAELDGAVTEGPEGGCHATMTLEKWRVVGWYPAARYPLYSKKL